MIRGRDTNPYSRVATDEDYAEDFLKTDLKRAKNAISEQEGSLGLLGDAVNRIGQMARQIGEEVSTQNLMLDDLGKDIETATTNMDLVTAKTNDLIKKSGKSNRDCIKLEWRTLILRIV